MTTDEKTKNSVSLSQSTTLTSTKIKIPDAIYILAIDGKDYQDITNLIDKREENRRRSRENKVVKFVTEKRAIMKKPKINEMCHFIVKDLGELIVRKYDKPHVIENKFPFSDIINQTK